MGVRAVCCLTTALSAQGTLEMGSAPPRDASSTSGRATAAGSIAHAFSSGASSRPRARSVRLSWPSALRRHPTGNGLVERERAARHSRSATYRPKPPGAVAVSDEGRARHAADAGLREPDAPRSADRFQRSGSRRPGCAPRQRVAWRQARCRDCRDADHPLMRDPPCQFEHGAERHLRRLLQVSSADASLTAPGRRMHATNHGGGRAGGDGRGAGGGVRRSAEATAQVDDRSPRWAAASGVRPGAEAPARQPMMRRKIGEPWLSRCPD